MRKEFIEKWEYFMEKLAYPYEYFISIDDFETPVDNMKKRVKLKEVNQKMIIQMILKYNEQKILSNYSIIKMEKS